MKVLYQIERLLLAWGLICVLIYVSFHFYSSTMYRAGLWSFSRLKNNPPDVRDQKLQDTSDFSSWAGDRVAAYKRALAIRVGAPSAVLSIPRLRLNVPVFEGTDALTLNRGAGRIEGTARPGEFGNIGIAAHRDGLFRNLKDIRLGDRIELAQLQRQFTYRVDNIKVVDPRDTAVLKARAQPSLTLVTCYPFHFAGAAPQRYIVQASLANSLREDSESDVHTSELKKEKMR